MSEIENPYLNEYGHYFVDLLHERVHDAFEARKEAIKRYAWTCPSDAIGPALVEHGITHLVEIGAGNGYWAWFLRQFGIQTLAYDLKPYGDDANSGHRRWAEVLEGGPEMVIGMNRQALLLVWPPYDDPMAYEALKHYEGDTVVFVGERYGGATGDDAFHALLVATFEQVWSHYGPNWPGIHSSETIWKRKDNT
jgi:hypothetical protein